MKEIGIVIYKKKTEWKRIVQKSGWKRRRWLLAYIRRKATRVSGEAPKIFLIQDVRCKIKEVKEDAYKEKMKRRRELEYKR